MEEPRKPANAYWLYLADHRETITKEAGCGRGSAVGKLAGEKWKALPGSTKAPYEKRAAELKAEYEKSMHQFKDQGGVAGERRRRKAEAKVEKTGKRTRRSSADPNKPKKPQTAYWLWLGANRAAFSIETGGQDVTKVSKLAGERWKVVQDATKEPFEKKAAELKAAYDKAMEEYRAHATEAGEPREEPTVAARSKVVKAATKPRVTRPPPKDGVRFLKRNGVVFGVTS